ncbi:DUF4124 domain-containing protein [Aeromonas caviae]|nr:DUF4124 domain-containing protein [Aeromonas caviae]
MNTVPWLLSLLLMASCSAQAARVYSWVDPQGVTHYTDAPLPARAQKRWTCGSRRSSAQPPTRSRWTTSTA